MSIYEKEAPKGDGLFIKLDDGDSVKIRMIGGGIDYTRVFNEKEGPKVRFASIVLYRNKLTEANEVKVFEFGWMIQKQLKLLRNNEDWGDLEGYDVTVSREGKDLETKYTITPSPKSIRPLTDAEKELIAEANIDLRAVCKVGVQEDTPDGDYDPFGTEAE